MSTKGMSPPATSKLYLVIDLGFQQISMNMKTVSVIHLTTNPIFNDLHRLKNLWNLNLTLELEN